jgi:hypothetical protein
LRTMIAMSLAAALFVVGGTPATAKVAIVPLVDLVREADFIGIARIERVGLGIPLLRKPRANAVVLETWKGAGQKRVSFVAAPTWTCDISHAEKGEIAIVFIGDGVLLHSGRGRMPTFTRENRTLAAVWDDVLLPSDIASEAGPDPRYSFIRGVPIDDLREIVRR